MTETNRFMGDIRTAYESGDVETLAIMASRNAAHVVDLRDRLARVERQAFFRDELEARGIEVPEWAKLWVKHPKGNCEWDEGVYGYAPVGAGAQMAAPDLLPDTEGPCWRAVLNGED